jgi:hypothetical protein
MNTIPRLRVSRGIQKTETYDPDRMYLLRYRSKTHRHLPHVVKFSGGRSSAMLLFILLENQILKPERGDVVVFNNTSCEHPETYRFAAECRKRTEQNYGVPFFFNEFQTYEDARQGEWRRLPSYRLVNDRPVADENPPGFHWRGEVFEELVSHKAYLPNPYRRVCTTELKLEPTREFLADWLAGKPGIEALGHGSTESLIDFDEMYQRHERAGGGVPREILLDKRRCVLSRSPNRPAQSYGDFSSAFQAFENPTTEAGIFGGRAKFGKGGVEYVSLIGLRGDEPLRVARVQARASDPHANAGYEGEHVYMPFSTMHVSRDDVNRFWNAQDFNLELDPTSDLSNCVYCFMKGAKKLGAVHGAMRDPPAVPGFGPTVGTPSDVEWWRGMEESYGRDLIRENRPRRNPNGSTKIGFFGLSNFNYQIVAQSVSVPETLAAFEDSVLPCECTD